MEHKSYVCKTKILFTLVLLLVVGYAGWLCRRGAGVGPCG